MADAIKVHLYQVLNGANTPDLETVLELMERTELADRLRLLGRNEIRLESVLAPRGPRNPTPYWFLDFTRLRFEHGPGKASRTDPVEGFPLAADEGFGEETAALYDPTRGYMLVQYNHHGVRASTIRDYLSFVMPGELRSYEFRVKFDETAEARLAQKQIITKLHFKLAPASMTDAQRAANVGLGRALELNDSLQGQTVEVVISAGRGRNAMLQSRNVSRMISGIQAILRRDEDVVEKFEVVAKAQADDHAEAIDLLTPKLEQEIDGIIMGPDRRYTQRSRWDALLRARNGWTALLR